MRILIIEDEESLARNISDILTKEGYLTEIASDGEQGLKKGLSEEYNLMILDILMPKLNGYEVLRELLINLQNFMPCKLTFFGLFAINN